MIHISITGTRCSLRRSTLIRKSRTRRPSSAVFRHIAPESMGTVRVGFVYKARKLLLQFCRTRFLQLLWCPALLLQALPLLPSFMKTALRLEGIGLPCTGSRLSCRWILRRCIERLCSRGHVVDVPRRICVVRHAASTKTCSGHELATNL